MRILEPLPCGALKNKLEEVLTDNEKEQLKQLHITLNRDSRYPKASVFPYFESAEQFGCGAGVQHSYIDGHGNFGPCDFIEPTFGNVLNENIQYIWVKMSKAINGPHCQCIAKNCDICKQLPRFYKLMRGYKK